MINQRLDDRLIDLGHAALLDNERFQELEVLRLAMAQGSYAGDGFRTLPFALVVAETSKGTVAFTNTSGNGTYSELRGGSLPVMPVSMDRAIAFDGNGTVSAGMDDMLERYMVH